MQAGPDSRVGDGKPETLESDSRASSGWTFAASRGANQVREARPTAILPTWTRPISWALPPYWGVLALRHAALGGDVWRPLAMLLVLGVISIAISTYTFRLFEHLARARATLSLT